MPELRSVLFQTRAPLNEKDPGAVEVAYYTLDAGELVMRTAEGSKTGRTYRLELGDDERRIACRLGKRAWRAAQGTTDFNRPLHYRPLGLA